MYQTLSQLRAHMQPGMDAFCACACALVFLSSSFLLMLLLFMSRAIQLW